MTQVMDRPGVDGGERQSELARLITRLPKRKQQRIGELFELANKAVKADNQEDLVEIIDTIVEMLSPKKPLFAVDIETESDAAARQKLLEYRRKVGRAVRTHRIKLGMTQTELAARTNLPQSHISRIEQGRHVPTHVTIKKLATALRTRPSTLDPGFDD